MWSAKFKFNVCNRLYFFTILCNHIDVITIVTETKFQRNYIMFLSNASLMLRKYSRVEEQLQMLSCRCNSEIRVCNTKIVKNFNKGRKH